MLLKNYFIVCFFIFNFTLCFASNSLYLQNSRDYFVITKDIRTVLDNTPLIYKDQSHLNLSNIFSDKDTCNIHLKNKLFKYEVKIHKAYSNIPLSLEEIKATLLNFSKKFVTTADTGLVKIDGDNSLYLIKDGGLLYSYIKNYHALDSLFFINKEYIKTLRNDSFSFDKGRENKGTAGKIYVSIDPIANETVKELSQMGYEVFEYGNLSSVSDARCKSSRSYSALKRQKEAKRANRVLCIVYPTEERVEELLKEYVETLLIKINDYYGYPDDDQLADLLAYSVRHLLLVHPFSDGSGRTARLLGQIIFKKIMDKEIIFSEEFFREMNYSHIEMKDKVKQIISKPCSDKIN